jgi:hypothetical protein
MPLLIYTFNYRFDGQIAHSVKHKFTDDLDALDTAEKLAAEFEIEVLNGDRFVARVNKGSRASNTQDARSG